MPTLHVHLDESGDLNFSKTGTRYYVFAVAWTFSPRQLAEHLQGLHFRLLKEGLYSGQEFHARENTNAVRSQVLGLIRTAPAWEYVAVVVDKPKVHPAHWDKKLFYWRFASVPLGFVLRSKATARATRALIYTSRFPSNIAREPTEKGIQKACNRAVRDRLKFTILHHANASNAWLQVADYCSWSVFRKWEHGDPSFYRQLRPRRAKMELNVLAEIEKLHYEPPPTAVMAISRSAGL